MYWHLQLVFQHHLDKKTNHKNLKWLLISFRVETKDTRSVEGRWHGDSSGSDNRGRWLLWDCDTRTCRDSRTEHSSPVKHRKFYFCRLWQSVIDNCRVSIVSGQLIPLYKWYDRIIFIIYSILIINILFDKTTTSVTF